MVKGTCKWFDKKKGYGFITPEDGSNDVFVHYSAIKGAGDQFKIIYEGDILEFDITQGAKGPQAENVQIVQSAPRQSYKSRGSRY
jgi:CspA family cold shock protein